MVYYKELTDNRLFLSFFLLCLFEICNLNHKHGFKHSLEWKELRIIKLALCLAAGVLPALQSHVEMLSVVTVFMGFVDTWL